MEDLISILMPICNAEDTLEECLESISAQSYSNFEVVAVEDGSGDSSPAILAEFARQDPRIRIMALPKNCGIVKALNHGLIHCRGKWIARMDADDIMRPDRLRLQREYLQDHPEIDLLGTRIRVFRRDGDLTPGQTRYQDWSNSLLTDRAIKREIFAESPVMHPTFFLRKSFYRKLEGYRDSPWAEDYDFLLRAYMENARIAKIPEVLLDKRDSPTRLARTDIRCKRKAMFQAKAHFFAQKNWLKNMDRFVIAGSGSSGRMAYAALKKENVSVDSFVDNISGSGERTVAGLPARTLDAGNAAEFFSAHSRSFFLVCIGLAEGRQMTEALLRQYGRLPVRDYLRLI